MTLETDKKLSRLRIEAERERVQEEIDYLRRSDAISVFKDAAIALREHYKDARVFLNKPSKDYYGKPVNVSLGWDFTCRQKYSYDQINYPVWSCRVVTMQVVRGIKGEIEGFAFTNVDGVIPPDREKISSRLQVAIKNPTTVENVQPPSLIRGVFAFLRG